MMSMQTVLAVIVVLAGASTVVQTAMNAQIRVGLGHGLLGAGVNFMVGLATLAAIIFVMRVPLPSVHMLAQVPTWAWFGGVFGAFFVASLTFAGWELGAVMVVVLVVTGQLIASLVMDHFGWLGYPVRPISVSRVLGSILLVIALVLFTKGK